jgi:hypothetical protein
MMLRAQAVSSFRAIALVVVLVAGSAACGGSGSSGFDGPASEPEAIEQALRDGVCVEFSGTTYCASGVPVLVGDDSAMVDFAGAADPVPCAALPEAPACSAPVGFAPEGFPDATEFLGAWATSARGPWRLSGVDTAAPGSAEGDEDVVVVLPDAAPTPADPLVVAVLVYLGGRPGASPEVSQRLRGFRADFAYLKADVRISR